MSSRERFSAVISIPDGLVNAPPIFEHRPSIDPITSRVCQIQPGARTNTYKLEVTNLDACGVELCEQPDGSVNVNKNRNQIEMMFRLGEYFFLLRFGCVCRCDSQFLPDSNCPKMKQYRSGVNPKIGRWPKKKTLTLMESMSHFIVSLIRFLKKRSGRGHRINIKCQMWQCRNRGLDILMDRQIKCWLEINGDGVPIE